MQEGQGKARVTDITELVRAVNANTAAVTRHTDELTERLFGSGPTSLQSQITAIRESTLSDNPTSLRSRVTETEKSMQFGKAMWAALLLFIGGLLTFCAINFQKVAGWLGYAPKSLPMILQAPRHGLYDFCVKASSGLRAFAARLWFLWVFLLCASGPKIQSVLRRFF